CLRKVEASRIWDLIDREGVTHYCGAPTVQIGIVNDPKAHTLSRPVTCAVAGAPPSPTLLAKLKELGFRPVHVYGLTETYGPHTVCAWDGAWDRLPADEMATKAARQGQGYVLFDLVRVVDEQGRNVAMDGETLGEVIMRGNNVMKGYFEQPDATVEAFRGGWFHSGDIAVWHPDGYIELRDRKKDIIISGGENISTIEVEQAVARHPAVMECAVVAVPDDKWGERPKAFVTLKPGMQARRTAKGFTGQVDDALLRDVIGAYRKQLQKALAEYEKLGERGAAQAAQLRFEIEFCERFLPRGLDVTALRSLVQERARSL